MSWLIIIGIIANTSLGFINKWEHWPILTVSLIAVLFLYAGLKLQYSLLRARFYFKHRRYGFQLLSLPPSPFKASMSLELTISNQGREPRGISEIVLEIQTKNGIKKEFPPLNLDDQTKNIINLYLKPHDPKTIPLYFIYDVEPMPNSERLIVSDDRGSWCRIPINIDTMSKMAEKSKSRSGDYSIE